MIAMGNTFGHVREGGLFREWVLIHGLQSISTIMFIHNGPMALMVLDFLGCVTFS